jgi:plastocyanin
VRARRRGWGTVLLAGAAGVAGLGPLLWVTALPAAAWTTSVNINDNPGSTNGEGVFNPNVTTINVGDKVLWTNKTSTKHTVTSDPGRVTFDSGDLRGPGGQFEQRFTSVGTYTYHCSYHPKMVGRVDVVDPNAPTTTAPPPTTATTAPPTTTSTAPPPPTTAPPTTTTTEPKPAFGMSNPPTTAAPAPPPTTAPPTTTTKPPTTTTTTPPATTATSAPPVLAGGAEGGAPPPSSAPPPTTASTTPPDTGGKNQTAAGPPVSRDGELDVQAVLLVSALVAVGAFGVWTLIRIRPGRI